MPKIIIKTVDDLFVEEFVILGDFADPQVRDSHMNNILLSIEDASKIEQQGFLDLGSTFLQQERRKETEARQVIQEALDQDTE